MTSPLVIIESPFAGQVARNRAYLRKCMKDSFRRGEFPFASHMMYTQVLNDKLSNERALGINAGLSWGEKADYVAVYADYGISAGMKLGILHWESLGKRVEYRNLAPLLTCENCKLPFPSMRKKKYCSPTCRRAYHTNLTKEILS